MSKNIEINIATSNNIYEVLYPKTTYSNMADVLNIVNTIGILDISRLSRIPVDIVKGSFIGTKSYMEKNIYNDFYVGNLTLLQFPGKTTRPDIVVIVLDMYDRDDVDFNIGVFGQKNSFQYTYGGAFFVNERINSMGTTATQGSIYSVYMTRSINMIGRFRVSSTENGSSDTYAPNNGFYFEISSESVSYNEYEKEASSLWTLANNNYKYYFYGFYFS